MQKLQNTVSKKILKHFDISNVAPLASLGYKTRMSRNKGISLGKMPGERGEL